MPRYYGGKGQSGKYIASIINQKINQQGPIVYIEPMCGMLGVFKWLYQNNNIKEALMNDISLDLINLLIKVLSGKFDNPMIYTKEQWTELKKSNDHTAERGYAGFCCSYGGVFFNGYVGSDQKLTDQQYKSFNSEKFPRFDKTDSKIDFKSMDYEEFLESIHFDPSKNYIIYFDPPYYQTKYKWKKFDYERFKKIMKKYNHLKNVTIYLSERKEGIDFYFDDMPLQIEFEKQLKRKMGKNKGEPYIEYLVSLPK